ncbi:MAG: hypothetical protein K2J85_00890, partial [Anaeroplasmataceae bacterium]|nr:hypothetical protein [Anaeroplasmataceae bacterium]
MNSFGFTISDKDLSGKLILVSLIVVIIGFVLLITLTRINANYFIHGRYVFSHLFPPLPKYFAFAGVPNNSFPEFDIPISNISQEILQAYEVKKGIYEIRLNGQNYIFDMRGWIHKRYYIFEIILTKFQIKYMLKGNIKSLCSSLCVE